MTASISTLRPGRTLAPVTPEAARERTIRRRVRLVWGLLMLNAIGYSGLIVHVPSLFGKAITQAAAARGPGRGAGREPQGWCFVRTCSSAWPPCSPSRRS